MQEKKLISIIIPVLNEEKNIPLIYSAIKKVFKKLLYNYEIIFINDGSKDKTINTIEKLEKRDKNIKAIDLSRNFGKEIAITAGIHNATGDACIMIDADLQHPPELIPEFIKKWEKGYDVVIGVRNQNASDKLIKRIGSFIFYKIINSISTVKQVPQSTDFRIIDRIVIDEFTKFSERNRQTRGLIDWMGFKREFIYFNVAKREHGEPGYSVAKLVRLAFNSIVSLTLFPLRVVGYMGILITAVSAPIGIFIFFEKYIFKDPFKWRITGTAILGIVIIFLVGIILISLGLITLYIAHIHAESIKRPLYIIRKRPPVMKGKKT